jgi:hypothetical protein
MGTFLTIDSRGLAVHLGGATRDVFASAECKALGLSKQDSESKTPIKASGVRRHKPQYYPIRIINEGSSPVKKKMAKI